MKLCIGIVILIKSTKLTKVSLISVLQSLIGAQFLNTTCVIAPSAISSVLAAFLLVTVIFPVTKYMHQNNQRLDSNNFVKILLAYFLNNYLLIRCQ